MVYISCRSDVVTFQRAVCSLEIPFGNVNHLTGPVVYKFILWLRTLLQYHKKQGILKLCTPVTRRFCLRRCVCTCFFLTIAMVFRTCQAVYMESREKQIWTTETDTEKNSYGDRILVLCDILFLFPWKQQYLCVHWLSSLVTGGVWHAMSHTGDNILSPRHKTNGCSNSVYYVVYIHFICRLGPLLLCDLAATSGMQQTCCQTGTYPETARVWVTSYDSSRVRGHTSHAAALSDHGLYRHSRDK